MTDAAEPGTVSGPGWHPDPAGAEGTYRWWDGERWTRWLSTDPGAAAPGGEDTPSDPAPEPVEAPVAAAPAAQRPPGYERTEKTSADGSADGPRSRRPLLLGLGALVVAVIVVIAVVVYGNRSDPGVALPPPSGGSSVTGSASPSAGAVSLDSSSRTLTIGTFSTELPAAPYTYDDSVLNYPPMLSSGVLATAPVDKEYDGKHTWFAAMFVGQLDPSVVVEGDAKKTADEVFAGLVSVNFVDTKTTTGTITTKATSQAGVKRAAVAQGHVNYQIKGVSSRYDQVNVLVAELDDGTWIGYLTSRPEKAPGQVKNALQASIDSITVR